MTNNLPFFSAEWCEEAKELVNANDMMYSGFKDADSFTNRMEFGVGDRGLRVHIEWQAGKVVSFAPAHFDAGDLWLVIRSDLATWRDAAEGRAEGGALLLEDRIQIVEGPISAAIENGLAFNEFLRTWGRVPTEWNV